MSYKGRYIPKNPKKYKGNPQRIIYRSMWERRLMDYCDRTSRVLEWGSEEIAIPYVSPVDQRIHRYFPDFYMKVKQKDGTLKRFIIEVKPKGQLKPPTKTPKKSRLMPLIVQNSIQRQNIVKIKGSNLRY